MVRDHMVSPVSLGLHPSEVDMSTRECMIQKGFVRAETLALALFQGFHRRLPFCTRVSARMKIPLLLGLVSSQRTSPAAGTPQRECSSLCG